MTSEEQRIAIAEACGWKPLPKDGRIYEWESSKGEPTLDVPDYLNDLNAMADAEKTLTGIRQIHCYVVELAKLSPFGQTDALRSTAWCISATAPQRAEAFLKTINKWTTD